jgi:hypothetical protein
VLEWVGEQTLPALSPTHGGLRVEEGNARARSAHLQACPRLHGLHASRPIAGSWSHKPAPSAESDPNVEFAWWSDGEKDLPDGHRGELQAGPALPQRFQYPHSGRQTRPSLSSELRMASSAAKSAALGRLAAAPSPLAIVPT